MWAGSKCRWFIQMVVGISRRSLVLAAALLCAALATATVALGSPSQPRGPAASLSSLEQGVLADINAFRKQHRLAPLRLSAALTMSAREHSRPMAAHGDFGHQSPDGTALLQ